MCNDIFVPFTKQNKVLHIWDEKYVPVITDYDKNHKYAVYNGEKLCLKVDLCSMELFKRSDIYENGVPTELIEKRLLVFRNKKCIESSFMDILMDAIPIFDCAEQDYVISGCVIAQSNGQFLNIYDGLLDNSVPKAEEK